MGEDSLVFRFIESLQYMKKVFEYQTEKELRCVVVNRAEYPLYVRSYASISKRATSLDRRNQLNTPNNCLNKKSRLIYSLLRALFLGTPHIKIHIRVRCVFL